jgi:hypothetical protein
MRSCKSGQVVAEYVMILSFVFLVLAATKFKVDVLGQVDFENKPGSKTIMEHLTESFSIWMSDMLIIISLPT